jgi:hypothetical protein
LLMLMQIFMMLLMLLMLMLHRVLNRDDYHWATKLTATAQHQICHENYFLTPIAWSWHLVALYCEEFLSLCRHLAMRHAYGNCITSRAERNGFRTPVGATDFLFFALVETGSEAHPPSCMEDTGKFFQGQSGPNVALITAQIQFPG